MARNQVGPETETKNGTPPLAGADGAAPGRDADDFDLDGDLEPELVRAFYEKRKLIPQCVGEDLVKDSDGKPQHKQAGLESPIYFNPTGMSQIVYSVRARVFRFAFSPGTVSSGASSAATCAGMAGRSAPRSRTMRPCRSSLVGMPPTSKRTCATRRTRASTFPTRRGPRRSSCRIRARSRSRSRSSLARG